MIKPHVVGMRTKQFPVQWMYWWWVLNVALDIWRWGSVVHATKPNLTHDQVIDISKRKMFSA